MLPVGIDLGTTLSAVATIGASGQTMMIPDELGDLLTPSIVRFGESETIVGRDALKEIGYDTDGIADTAKRDIGKPFYRRQIHGKSLPPEIIQACILRHLKQIVDGHLQDEYGVVVTVPAFFDERRRKSRRTRGAWRGFTCWISSTSRRRRHWHSVNTSGC